MMRMAYVYNINVFYTLVIKWSIGFFYQRYSVLCVMQIRTLPHPR